MSLANALKKAASASLKKLGGDVTIKRQTDGIYDAASGTYFSNESSVTVKGALSNVSMNQVGGLIESQDRVLKISAGDITFVPTTKDSVIVSNIEFKIIRVSIDEQNNIPISYDLLLR